MLSNREPKDLQQILGASCLLSYWAVIPNFTALAPLWVQGAGSLRCFGSAGGVLHSESHTVQLDIEILPLYFK